jgi:hypothetical protein
VLEGDLAGQADPDLVEGDAPEPGARPASAMAASAASIWSAATLLPEFRLCQPVPPRPGATALGSRGSPRPRSAMMFFWICEVPPPMISPTSYM